MTKKNKRLNFFKRTYIVEHAFQVRFILKIVSFVILATFITGAVTYFLTNEALERSFYSIHYQIKNVWQVLLPSVVVISFITTAIVAFFTTIVALFESHKVGGPIYRFKKNLKEIEDGDLTVNTQLRERDELKDFVGSLNSMVEGVRGKVVDIDDNYNKLVRKINIVKDSLLSKEELTQSDREMLSSLNEELEVLGASIHQFEFRE